MVGATFKTEVETSRATLAMSNDEKAPGHRLHSISMKIRHKISMAFEAWFLRKTNNC